MTNPAVFLNHQQSEAPSSASMPRAGQGTRLTVNELGEALSIAPQGQTFNHPFRAFLGGRRMTFRLGTVRSVAGSGPIEPKIIFNGTVLPMSGANGTNPVPLLLDPAVAKDSVSYAVLEVHPDDATGELLATSQCEIIHTNAPVSAKRTIGRCALALILWHGRSPLRIIQGVHFNLVYLRQLTKPGEPIGAPKHYFL